MNYAHEIEKVSASAKVSEVFLTAGIAFQKLGDLTLQLNDSDDSQENMRWTDSEMERLREALYKFACEIDQIGQQVQQRTKKQIKTDVRRKLTVRDDLRAIPAQPKLQRQQQKFAHGKAIGPAITNRPLVVGSKVSSPYARPAQSHHMAGPSHHITYTYDDSIQFQGPPAF